MPGLFFCNIWVARITRHTWGFSNWITYLTDFSGVEFLNFVERKFAAKTNPKHPKTRVIDWSNWNISPWSFLGNWFLLIQSFGAMKVFNVLFHTPFLVLQITASCNADFVHPTGSVGSFDLLPVPPNTLICYQMVLLWKSSNLNLPHGGEKWCTMVQSIKNTLNISQKYLIGMGLTPEKN